MDDIIGIGWRCRCGFEEMGTENTWWYEQHTVGSKHIHKVSCNRAWLSSMDCQHPPTWAGVGFVLSRGKGCHDCGRLRWSEVLPKVTLARLMPWLRRALSPPRGTPRGGAKRSRWDGLECLPWTPATLATLAQTFQKFFETSWFFLECFAGCQGKMIAHVEGHPW